MPDYFLEAPDELNIDPAVAELLATATNKAEGVIEVDGNELPGIRTLVEQLRGLRDEKTALEIQLKAVETRIGAVEPRIREAMMDSGLSSMRVEGIGLAYLSSTTYPSVGDPDRLVAWLDENGHGELARRGVHPSTLRSWWQETVENGGELPPDDVATAFTKTSVRLRRA